MIKFYVMMALSLLKENWAALRAFIKEIGFPVFVAVVLLMGVKPELSAINQRLDKLISLVADNPTAAHIKR